ncbi:MAG: hypothetical protein H5U13_00455 [Parvibaculum sp.]|nr:hypothetical protein [Parvibaculum sp.]
MLDAFDEARRNYYLGGLRLSAVEGGRFCESVFRILEHIANGQFTPLGRQLDTEMIIRAMMNLDSAAFSDSIRLHVPRALRVVYDIRNKRDAAHLADGIDPNIQDATLVISVLDWVLAELVRLYHDVPPEEAREMVEALVTKKAPVIQEFGDVLKVLNPDLSASGCCLVLLYQRAGSGASFEEVKSWVRPKMRANLRRTLRHLANVKDMIHEDGDMYQITRRGEMYVETSKLLEP